MNEQIRMGSKSSLSSIGAIILRFRAFFALILIMLLFSFLSSSFLTWSNLVTVLVQSSINGLLAIGMTLVIVSGGIDLSVGAIAGLCGMVAGALIDVGIPLPMFGVVLYPHARAAILIGIGAGAFVGAINGFVITRLKVTPFIATLGMMYIARGVALLSNNGSTFPFLNGTAAHGNQGLAWIGNGLLLGIPVPIWLLVLACLAAMFTAQRTTFGMFMLSAAMKGPPRYQALKSKLCASGFMSSLAG